MCHLMDYFFENRKNPVQPALLCSVLFLCFLWESPACIKKIMILLRKKSQV